MLSSKKLIKSLNNFNIVEDNSIVLKNYVLEISIPRLNFIHSIYGGKAMANSDIEISPLHQFHIASITKTMTATLILQMWEDGNFGSKGLDISLGELSVFTSEVLDRLHIINNISNGQNITIRQLLSHTSGLKDPYSDDANGISADYGYQPAPESIVAKWQLDFKKMGDGDPSFNEKTSIIYKDWNPWDASQPNNVDAGMINYYINTLGDSPVALPGEIFHYSDTGFVILALIAEKISKKSYHSLLRNNIFDTLNMDSTYLAYASKPKPDLWEKKISDCYVDAFPLVTGGFNFSFDWGGGGVVSTAEDLNKFFSALIKGNLFKKKITIKEMTNWKIYQDTPKGIDKVGLGLFETINKNGIVLWGHTGAWGSAMYYEPASDMFISGTINQLFSTPNSWIDRLINRIHKEIY